MGHTFDALTPIDHVGILARLSPRFFGSAPEHRFASLCSDDRNLVGDLFVAIRGAHYDSHRVITDLPQLGFRGVVAEDPPPAAYSLPYYQVEDSRRALGLLEQGLAGDPAQRLRVLGVTGTNGKSTTVRLVTSILEAHRRTVGWYSTVTARLGDRESTSQMTTPEPRTLARGLARLVASGGTDAVLEVSSHALHQGRVAGIEFSGAALTNVSHDHYDYHGSAEAYLAAKLSLFRELLPGSPAVIPADGPVDVTDERLAGAKVLVFGEDCGADAFPERFQSREDGLTATLRILGEPLQIRSRLAGRHNLLNVLAAALLTRVLGVPQEALSEGVESAPAVRGRLEPVPGGRGRVFIDYAHTPDALQSVLQSVREFTSGRLILVFGCGGDRDRGKRPIMGRLASRLGDLSIVTSDNPRGEDPAEIISEILSGMEPGSRFITEQDRRMAIRRGISEMRVGDVLVVAGKGHEQEQIVGGRRLPFDDREVVLAALREEASA